jgi:hypothetical protein
MGLHTGTLKINRVEKEMVRLTFVFSRKHTKINEVFPVFQVKLRLAVRPAA